MKTFRKILIRYYERKAAKLDREILKSKFDDPVLADVLRDNLAGVECKIKRLKEKV